ncbi:hypothetical protein UB43_01405 [Pseudomonas sp. 21]|nr:hypothetical protein UB43_01405 [Pseudomonas sp. 21]
MGRGDIAEAAYRLDGGQSSRVLGMGGAARAGLAKSVTHWCGWQGGNGARGRKGQLIFIFEFKMQGAACGGMTWRQRPSKGLALDSCWCVAEAKCLASDE